MLAFLDWARVEYSDNVVTSAGVRRAIRTIPRSTTKPAKRNRQLARNACQLLGNDSLPFPYCHNSIDAGDGEIFFFTVGPMNFNTLNVGS